MLEFLFKNVYLECDAPTPWGLYFQDSAAPAKWLGKSLLWVKLSNSGDALKPMVPNYSWKIIDGWSNQPCKVISQRIIERAIGNRGAKSVFHNNSCITVKVQRVDGSYVSKNWALRCTLMGFARNYQIKIPSNQINNKLRLYSSTATPQNEKQNLMIDPWFLSGFTDAEGCFILGIVKNNELKEGWVIRPRFQINLHKKDKVLLEQIQSFLCAGNINKQGSEAYQFRVDSVKGLRVIINHFDRYPLISQKSADYELFKQAFNLILNKEHLTKEGLRKIVGIKASINKGLSDELKTAFPGIKPVKKPEVENVFIRDPQWLAGFTSGEGCMLVRVKKSSTHRLGFLVELVFQINQHTRDKLLILNLIKYLNCGVVYKHSENAVVFKVTKFSDLTQNIIPFFSKYPILGVKSKDFYDFCEVADIMKEKGHLTIEGLNKIRLIRDRMNTGRNFEV